METWKKLAIWCNAQIKFNPTQVHEQMGHPVFLTHLELHVLVLELQVPVPEVWLHGRDQVVRHVPLLTDLQLQLVNVLLSLLKENTKS